MFGIGLQKLVTCSHCLYARVPAAARFLIDPNGVDVFRMSRVERHIMYGAADQVEIALVSLSSFTGFFGGHGSCVLLCHSNVYVQGHPSNNNAWTLTRPRQPAPLESVSPPCMQAAFA